MPDGNDVHAEPPRAKWTPNDPLVFTSSAMKDKLAGGACVSGSKRHSCYRTYPPQHHHYYYRPQGDRCFCHMHVELFNVTWPPEHYDATQESEPHPLLPYIW